MNASADWLFDTDHLGRLRRGLIRLNLDEAALLWEYAAAARQRIVEIGRRFGGSLCLLTMANPSVPVDSVDIAAEMHPRCSEFLTGRHVTLLDADSRSVPLTGLYDLAFIDGDHQYAGVKADFENLLPHLAAGAHVLFHDAVRGAGGACPDVVRYVQELLGFGILEKLESKGSMMATRLFP